MFKGTRLIVLSLVGVLMLVLMAACSAETPSDTTAPITVTNAWGRTSPMAAANGAFYMSIQNNTDEDQRIINARAEVCGMTELHEMYMQDAENEVMGMRQVEDGILIPAGETVNFEVGGLHVMCMEKTDPFELGDEYPIILQFEDGNEITVIAEIREDAP